MVAEEGPVGPEGTETHYCGLVLRTQLSTGASKSDVYFARRRRDGALVVVKGPLAAEGEARHALEMCEWKLHNNIPTTAAELVMLVPDRWPAGVPLGLRNRVPRDRPAPFLVIVSLVDCDGLARRTHQSKLWPPTEVFEGAALHLSFARLTPAQMRDYVEALLVRWLFGISDLADRNFLLSRSGRVVSIDEEYRDRNVSFQTELRKNRCAAIVQWLRDRPDHYDSLRVAGWTHVPERLQPRLATLLRRDGVVGLFSK